MTLSRCQQRTGHDAPDVTVRALQVGGTAGPLPARLYRGDANGKRDLLIVFFHGGGFIGGGLDAPDAFLRGLVTACGDALLLSSEYTLAAVKPFPAAVEDAYAVLMWSHHNKATLGWTGKQLLVAGIEAGANLAAVSALMARDRAGPRLTGQILITPMLDPGLSSASMRALPANAHQTKLVDDYASGYRAYLPHAIDRSHPYASPLQSSRLKNLPPALILSTEDEPLRDEAEAYGAKLMSAGVRTTVRRLGASVAQAREVGHEPACSSPSLAEIANFVALNCGRF